MAAKKKSPRTVRRALDRESEKLSKDREKLASLEAGGAPDRPIEVVTSSVIEGYAASMPCARCTQPVRVVEHTAETIGGARVRVVRVQCSSCGTTRPVYFRIVSALPN